jgi:hypothetical protein
MTLDELDGKIATSRANYLRAYWRGAMSEAAFYTKRIDRLLEDRVKLTGLPVADQHRPKPAA